ncbi:filamentous hemagglutinin family protein [Xanthomonas sp. 1678]|uniref:filamentous hemagglutinin family protein n=1 Tax=Xanthomonas sp. 1678 TaxID=3158788 RepID=UPI0028592F0E|nr:filamentous hemagglutinin family protein [Xanthomonas translucens]
MKQANQAGRNSANRGLRIKPLAHAITVLLVAGGMAGSVHAQQAFSAGWFAAKGAQQQAAAQTGQLPNGMPANLPRPQQQTQEARDKLKTSLENLGTAAQAIAVQQRMQQAARDAARVRPASVPDGLGEGGLKIDDNALTSGWHNAKDPTQAVAGGKTTVTIEQTGDKAVLNWETFNVGRDTLVDFRQDASWSVLNRINDPLARPSQIQGQINAPGTVFLVNRNGVVFGGSSQVNVKNLAAAAVDISDQQFAKGLYSDAKGSGFVPTFANDLASATNGFGQASGSVVVERGAQITTHTPSTVTEGGGYVMLLGAEVHNHGQISAANGQATLAAGDAFVIRKGMGTEQNQTSTTRGNVVTALRSGPGASQAADAAPRAGGVVSNTGLIQASTGDITLAGRDVRQQGTLLSTTSVHTRGTIHLSNDAGDADGQVRLGEGSLTAIVLDDSATTALDVQRETLVKDADKPGDGVQHRRDQSLVQIASGGDVTFDGGSLTLATSGQVLVDAAGTSRVQEGARIDVSGHVGVKIAMEANNVQINVQGNEQRDAPVNRDGKALNNNNIWLDRRDLVLVPAGTNGYEADRWYTAGGLLEVGGYLGITGHGIGEWSAQGGTVQFGGGELVSQRGSRINLSGGTLDVQTGYVNQTHLKGADGKLYNASTAPGDLLYTGLYRGFEDAHERWGNAATAYYYSPLIGRQKRLENGYTVGRDAGRLVVATRAATLEGDIETATFQGDRQTQAREQDLDGYRQSQTAAARNGELIVGSYATVYDKDAQDLRYSAGAVAKDIVIGQAAGDADADVDAGDDGAASAPADADARRIVLDAGWLNRQQLGSLQAYATDGVEVNEAVAVAAGGQIALHATQVDVGADLTARGGRIALGNVVEKWTGNLGWIETAVAPVPDGMSARTAIDEGVVLDTRGLWTNLARDGGDIGGMPYAGGGDIGVRSSGSVSVGKGALLDASAGAVLMADDTLRGGRGGDIALMASDLLTSETVDDAKPGRLTLAGEVRSQGVKGGGRLTLQSGGSVVIGGQVPGSDGVLRQGEASLIDLITESDFSVAEGAVLPSDYRYTRSHAKPGEAVGSAPVVAMNRPETHLTLAAAWTLPLPDSGASYWVNTSAGEQIFVYSYNPPPQLPAGTVITNIDGTFPTGYVVQGKVFPSGLAVKPATAVVKAGDRAPVAVVFEAGTRIAAGRVLQQDVAVAAPLHLDADLFAQGFSSYEIHGQQSLAVAEGATIDVRMPVLQWDRSSARLVETGADPSAALTLWQPPQFQEDVTAARLSLRDGADLQLHAGSRFGAPSTLSIGEGARIGVDPGRSIGLTGNGQITVEGTLRAAGGHIDLQIDDFDPALNTGQSHDRSLWIGETALLDVAGLAHVALDAQGRRYGQVTDGGRIQIGATYNADATEVGAADAFVVVRPGARLEASGAAATLDVPQGQAAPIASDGGLIHLASSNGLFVDGDLRAAAGGAGAAGGTLALALETPNYPLADRPDPRVRSVREMHLVAEQEREALPEQLQPGYAGTGLDYGHARIGVDRIQAGGFDNLSLLVNGVLGIGDGVDLQLGQSLRLTAGSISLAPGSQGADIALAAPYVRLAGATRSQKDHHAMPYPVPSGLPDVLEGSRLTIDSSLLDVIEDVAFGTAGIAAQASGTPLDVQRAGFETVELRSQGDLRFLKATAKDRTSLDTGGDLVLAASQIYPATGALAEVNVGRYPYLNQWGGEAVAFDGERSLRIERTGSAEPRVPFSVFGSLYLRSAAIDQGGVLRAPLGTIVMGSGNTLVDPDEHDVGQPSNVVLRPGSITSASAAGLTMPYGGTVDGLTYTYDGRDVTYQGLGSLMGSVQLDGGRIEVQDGASIDLSGGGKLAGAAFLSGRGGSTDARLNPLVQMAADGGGFVLPGLSTNPVYAIVPGTQPGYAPVAQEHGAGDPAIGRQITLGEGVPGLPAGTYTLLPSSYALLPGAFRVELNGLANSVAADGAVSPMRNGSYGASARLSVAGTDIADPLPTQAILTSADTLRAYSQYNETSFAEFGLAWAERDGVPRPLLERDAKTLHLAPGNGLDDRHGLQMADGTVRFAAAEGGYGGTLVVRGRDIEILGEGAAATEGFDGVSLHADVLNGVGASTLSIGNELISQFTDMQRRTQDAHLVSLGNVYTSARSITLREGAVLSAAQVFLISGQPAGGITVEQGASIDTLGRGAAAWDSKLGYVFDPGLNGVLALSNGWLDMLAPKASDGLYGSGRIDIGACAEGASCTGSTRLYAEGTITAATEKSFLLDESVRYGTRNLVLAVGGVNIGSEQALADAAARGVLPNGLTLNQQVLDRLLAGDTSTGAPALENLVLTARDSVNFFDSVELSTFDALTGKSSLKQLVLGTPALYGHGDAADVARIETDTLVWNGAKGAAGSLVAGGPGSGSGQLVVDARQIEFGYGPRSQADTLATHDRLALGFASVALNASERITANHKGSLSVYQSRDGWDDASKSFRYSGGDLSISTPLLTGHAGSVNTIKAGGNITATAPAGTGRPSPDNAALADALGAELVLDARGALTLDTAVLLPSGRLTLAADGDVALADRAWLDLAGRKIDFYDVSKYSWGGDVVLDSRQGDVLQSAASRIDISADFNRAGKLTAMALEGGVDLAGAIAAGSSGHYDAGGTAVPFASGYIDVRGQRIADFSGLNARLTAGEAFGGRSFQLGQGDLAVGDELKAREINVSVDNGSLTVNGTVDASGEQVGSIRLAANAGVTLAGSAVLDASASVLRTDSYGKAIEAPNRATIEIDSGDGRLIIGSGARMDLGVAGASADYGTVTLNAPRLGGATGNDVDIDASGTVRIAGARAVTVNAFHRYDDAAAGTDIGVDGRDYQTIDQAYLDRKHADSQQFVANALANGGLMNGKLGGLRAYGNQFHLRPGIEIVSSTADGDLHIDGDIDLSGHRYASVNPHAQLTGAYGSGEAGALLIRAGGDLEIFGSLSDGFDGSKLPVSPDDKGWVLPAGRMPWGGDLIIPHGGLVTLAEGTQFAAGRTLNYDLPTQAMTLPTGTVLPVAMPLEQALTLPAGSVLGAAVRDAGGNVVHAAGTVLQQPVELQPGMQLGAGFRLPSETQMAAFVWPAGVPLPANMTLERPLALAKGAIVPGETDVKLPGDAVMVNLRPAVDADGNQGRTWALAPMLPQGSQSWDLRLVAAADTAAADTRLVRHGSDARLHLADTHFGLGFMEVEIPGSGRPATYHWAPDVDVATWESIGVVGIVPGEEISADMMQMLRNMGLISETPLELNDWGLGAVAGVLDPGKPAETRVEGRPARQQLFSVLRTGTGDLDLISGGDFQMSSPYGIYTAGTASASLGLAYDQRRGRLADGSVLGSEGTEYEAWVDGGQGSLYQAWYPEHGGNLLLRAQGDAIGDLIGHNAGQYRFNVTLGNIREHIGTTAVGSWLWRQGTGSVDTGADAVPAAWWINFGTYVAGPANGQRDETGQSLFANTPFLTGFTGIGTLGGGNLRVEADGDAGMIGARGDAALTGQTGNTRSYAPRSQGLHLAVASTGRMTAAGELVQTGGGDLDIRIGGALNPNPGLQRNEHDLNSTFVNLRGALNLQAGAVGGVQLRYGVLDQMDSRGGDPFAAGRSLSGGGPVLVVGDATARLDSRGDLVLGGVVDPGRSLQYNATPFSYQGVAHEGEGWSWFSLWTPASAVDLFSAGGNLTPTTAWAESGVSEDVVSPSHGRNQSATLDGHFYPSILRAVAANGSMYYGVGTTPLLNPMAPQSPLRVSMGLTLAPSPHGEQFVNVTGKGELQLLAMDSIYASGYPITASTADPLALTSPFRPGFSGLVSYTGGGQWGFDPVRVHNVAPEAAAYSDWALEGGRYNGAALFTFASAATSAYAPQAQPPAQYYAVQGDIVGLRAGNIASLGYLGRDGVRYEGSIPVAIRAGRDITDSGTPLGKNDTVVAGKGNLVSHAHADDISVVEAGRDIRHSSFYVTGPGLLEVTAGRHLYFADKGELKSLGSVVDGAPGDRSSGASIAVAAGMGEGANWSGFAERYLDPGNQADSERPFADQPGKALTIYSGELTLARWLQREFGYSGDDAGAASFLAGKQAELDQRRNDAVAQGQAASNRSLSREYKVESRLHLVNWLSERFGNGSGNGLGLHFDAATMDARAFFGGLPPEQQRAFLRNVYYAELKIAGREYNDQDGQRFGSYLRGREAIATLLPEQDAAGHKRVYEGDLTLFSSALYYNDWVTSNGIGKDRPTPGKTYITKAEWEALGSPGYDVAFYDVLDAGIHTNFGGDISIMTPGGRTLVGVDGGFVPGAGSGVMTQGEGDINLYALDDILMGQSRIFTTFGGNILAWSAQGDINAGRGSKTTVVYTPQRRAYDDVGNVSLSPSAPNTGAGIATLNPVPEVPPGDIDLIAPLGTIDAGEAGIRVSGNVNLAALQVLNAENIQTQGEATGIPVVAAVNVSALTSASAAANSAVQAAQDMVKRQTQQARPSVISVQVLGFGEDSSSVEPPRKDEGYDSNSVVQVVGMGELTPEQRARLAPDTQ